MKRAALQAAPPRCRCCGCRSLQRPPLAAAGHSPSVPRRRWPPPSWPRRRWSAPSPSRCAGSPRAAPPPPAAGRAVTGGSVPAGRGARSLARRARSILYISIFLQRDAAVAVRVVHVEQNWGGSGRLSQGVGRPGPAPLLFPALPHTEQKTPTVKPKCQSQRGQGQRPGVRLATS